MPLSAGLKTLMYRATNCINSSVDGMTYLAYCTGYVHDLVREESFTVCGPACCMCVETTKSLVGTT
jgi:hypothetical protein